MCFNLIIFASCFHARAHRSLQCGSDEGAGERRSLRKERWGAEIFLTSQQEVWRGWRRLIICTFFPQVLLKTALESCSCINTQIDRKFIYIHSKNNSKKKQSCFLILSLHTFTHTSSPSSSHPLSSQRHEDIFIFHRAQTLMKHRRHKYISMISQIWLLPSLLRHTAASLWAFQNCHNAWELMLYKQHSEIVVH